MDIPSKKLNFCFQFGQFHLFGGRMKQMKEQLLTENSVKKEIILQNLAFCFSDNQLVSQ